MSQDDKLIKQIANGDESAFNMLFDRYKSYIHQKLLNIVQNEAYAEDLLQEVFLRLWRRAYQWKGIGKVKNWLARMATNLALNYLRSIKRRESQLRKLELEKDCEIERVLEHEEMYEKMKTLISSLPNHHRKVIEMVYQMEMDIEEVANELNISRGTVKSRLHYARKTLTERWRNIKKLYK